MARTLIHWGEFRSNKDVLWEVKLFRRDNGLLVIPSKLKFDSDALTIEWADASKLQVVEASSATLTIISPGDRTYMNLYSVEVGEISMNVYRDGDLYWSGTLDPELYEEPYAYLNEYKVALTFSDLSSLSRTNYTPDGEVVSIDKIITDCIALSEVSYTAIDKHISTELNGDVVSLSSLYVQSGNFIDEEGVPMSAKEVLQGVLQPFALKIRQKYGKFIIYDLNAIYNADNDAEIEWSSTDSGYSVDRTYSDVTLTFSPYSDATILDCSIDSSDIASEYNKTVYVDTSDNNIVGFKLHTSQSYESDNFELSGGARFFKIEPNNSGSSEAGIIYSAHADINQGATVPGLMSPELCSPSETPVKILKTSGRYVPAATTGYQLKISLDTLFDVRYNPFEDAGEKNEAGAWDKLQNWANIGYVGIRIYTEPSQGNLGYHYVNKNVFETNGYDGWGYWTPTNEVHFKECYLCYYDTEDRRNASGFNGWSKNKTLIGTYQGTLPSAWKWKGDGMTIALPPQAGKLIVEISNYIPQYDYKRECKDIYPLIRWVAFKDLKLEVVRSDGFAYNSEDITTFAWLNKSAAENLEISTIVGTMKDPVPTARGILLNYDREPILSNFTRAGVTDNLQQLLIGTAYSNYATRHSVLSGEVNMIVDKLSATDSNSDGKFWISGETQNTQEDCGSATFIQLKEESYQGINND